MHLEARAPSLGGLGDAHGKPDTPSEARARKRHCASSGFEANILKLCPLFEGPAGAKRKEAFLRIAAKSNLALMRMAMLACEFEPVQEPLVHIVVHLVHKLSS